MYVKKSLPDFIIICAILTIGSFFRFYGLFSTGLDNMLPDEGRIGLGAASIIHYKTPLFTYESPHEPPLSFYYVIPFMIASGRELWVLKLAPIFFGIGTILMTYLFSKEYFSRRVACVAALFMAVLPFAVEYSRTLYEHSFVPFFSSGAAYFFTRFLRDKNPISLYLFSAFAGLGCSTHIVFLYFIAALAFASIASGEIERFHVNLYRGVIASLIFSFCAIPFFSMIFLSIDLPNILTTSGGMQAVFSPQAFLRTLQERIVISGNVFTIAFLFGAAAWTTSLVLGEKKNSRALFLLLFCTAIIFIGVVTVAGMQHEYHMLVLLPIALVVPSSLVDMPVWRSPKIAYSFTAVAMVGLLVFAATTTLPSVKSMKMYNAGAFETVLESLDTDSSIAAQKDITMLHKYLRFATTGQLPDFRTSTITSLYCNNFRPCSPRTVFPDIDYMFREALLRENGGNPISWNSYSDPSFFTQLRNEKLYEVILIAIKNKGFSNFIFNTSSDPSHPHTTFSFRVRNALLSLAESGIIRIKTNSYTTSLSEYEVINILPAESH